MSSVIPSSCSWWREVAGDLAWGWLLTAGALADHWAELDEFEGDEYERLLTDVVLDDGTEVTAWIYGLRA